MRKCACVHLCFSAVQHSVFWISLESCEWVTEWAIWVSLSAGNRSNIHMLKLKWIAVVELGALQAKKTDSLWSVEIGTPLVQHVNSKKRSSNCKFSIIPTISLINCLSLNNSFHLSWFLFVRVRLCYFIYYTFLRRKKKSDDKKWIQILCVTAKSKTLSAFFSGSRNFLIFDIFFEKS